MINLENILDQIQELIGAPVGDFYNMESRIRAIDAAHNGLVRETYAVVRYGTATVAPGAKEVSAFPDDFLSFADSNISYLDAGATKAVVLDVTQPREMSANNREWESSAQVGTPTTLVIRSPGNVAVYPASTYGGVIQFNYISNGGSVYSMPPMQILEWVPFGGDTMLNQFAPALSYKVASDLMVARNPEVAAYMRKTYDQEVRKMRHTIRYDPAQQVFAAPGAMDGRSLYAPR